MGKWTNIGVIAGVGATIVLLALYRKQITSGFQTAGKTIGESIGSLAGQTVRSTIETFTSLLPKIDTSNTQSGVIIPPPVIDPKYVPQPNPSPSPAPPTSPPPSSSGDSSNKPPTMPPPSQPPNPLPPPSDPFSKFSQDFQKFLDEAQKKLAGIIVAPPIPIPQAPLIPAFASTTPTNYIGGATLDPRIGFLNVSPTKITVTSQNAKPTLDPRAVKLGLA